MLDSCVSIEYICWIAVSVLNICYNRTYGVYINAILIVFTITEPILEGILVLSSSAHIPVHVHVKLVAESNYLLVNAVRMSDCCKGFSCISDCTLKQAMEKAKPFHLD